MDINEFNRTVPIDEMISLTGEQPSAYYGNPAPVVQTPADPFFGTVINTLRDNLVLGGSELGLGMMLFALAVSIRAKTILEIGRHRGFSTFALAAALRFNEHGWDETTHNKQRPDVNYELHESREKGYLFSIDVIPNPAADELLKAHGLDRYVRNIDMDSKACEPTDMYDIMLIDGDHTFEGCLSDTERYVPKFLRPGGYFILHDWYGWYDAQGQNNSPIKRVGDFVSPEMERLLIDTGYQSFKIFRKQGIPIPSPRAAEVLSAEPQEILDLNTSNGILSTFTSPTVTDRQSIHG